VKERIEVTKWTCDGCGDTELEDEDGETRGYFGDVAKIAVKFVPMSNTSLIISGLEAATSVPTAS
jgi:hypothetical protein